jgi:outer membrane receptor protein involved in Fe transport
VSYSLSKESRFHGLQLSVTVNNLVDRKPPFYNTAAGYDSNEANPIGRTVVLAVTYRH